MKNAIVTDKAPLRGVFTMRVKDRDGNIVEEYEDHNMIVNGAKLLMAQLVSDYGKANYNRIKYIGFGTGTTAADPSDTDLQQRAVTKPIDGFEFPEGTDDRVQFNWSLDYEEGNGTSDEGMDIQEFGLFSGTYEYAGAEEPSSEDEEESSEEESSTESTGLVLFAKKTRTRAIFKDTSLSFEGTWTIIF